MKIQTISSTIFGINNNFNNNLNKQTNTMKNSTIFSYVLIPLVLALTFIGCAPQNPNQVYQQPIQQVVDYDNNGSYDTYYGSDGQQYAVTSIDGVQRSILLSTFLNQLNNGGYGAVYNYYNQYPTYFNTYTPGRTGWRHYGAPSNLSKLL